MCAFRIPARRAVPTLDRSAGIPWELAVYAEEFHMLRISECGRPTGMPKLQRRLETAFKSTFARNTVRTSPRTQLDDLRTWPFA